jgi:hypothetical protein
LPLAIEETLYRIAQEALHNIVKHAKAKQVWVGIHALGGGVRLRIQDDGRGFDPAAVPDGHLGLAGMRAGRTAWAPRSAAPVGPERGRPSRWRWPPTTWPAGGQGRMAPPSRWMILRPSATDDVGHLRRSTEVGVGKGPLPR